MASGLNFPVARIGEICKTERKFKFDEAKYTSELFIENSKTIEDIIANTLKNEGAKDITSENDIETIHEWPIFEIKNVIQFPRFQFACKDYLVRCKNSVKIPVYSSKGNIFTHLSLVGNDGKEATKLSAEYVNQFFNFSKEISNKLDNKLLPIYREILDKSNLPRRFSPAYKFYIFAVNSNDKIVNKLYNDLIEKNKKLIDFLKYKKFFNSMSDYLGLVSGKKMESAEDWKTEVIKKEIIPMKESFEILEAMARTYKHRQPLLIEAPTAIGKTYLADKFTAAINASSLTLSP